MLSLTDGRTDEVNWCQELAEISSYGLVRATIQMGGVVEDGSLEIMWTKLARCSVIVTENGNSVSQRHTAVHNDLCARDEAGLIRREKQHSVGNFFRLPEALHRLPGGEISTRGHRIWQPRKPLLQ